MATLKSYNAKDVKQVLAGKTLTGFTSGDMFSWSKDGENVTVVEDVQGFATAVINNTKISTVTVNLSAHSPQYKHAANLAKAGTVFAYSADTPFEKISAASAIITKLPDVSAGGGEPTRTITIKLLDTVVNVK